MPKLTKAALAARDCSVIKARALEMRIDCVEIADALRNHPRFYDDPLVMALLNDIDDNMCKAMVEAEESVETQLIECEEESIETGRKEVVKYWLEPLFGAAVFVINNWESGDLAAAIREMSEIVNDVRNAKVIS